jgi:hypothetical protein
VLVASGATTITLTHAETTADVGVDTITAQITSAPATSSVAKLSFSQSTEALGGPNGTGTYTDSTKTDQLYASNAGVAMAIVAPNRLATFKTTKLTLKINPDIAGTYTILVTANAASAAGYSAGKISTSYTVTTAGAPTTLAVTSVGGNATTSSTYGQLFGLSMKDADGKATVLGLNEAITFSDADTTTTLQSGPTSAGSAISSFGAGDDYANTGVYYVRALGSASAVTGTSTLTFVGSGLLPATLTLNTTITTKTTTASAGTITAACTTAANCTGTAPDFVSKAAQSLTFAGFTTGSTTAAVSHNAEVRDSSGFLYTSSVTIAAATTAATKATFSAPAPALGGTVVNVTVGGTTASLTYGAPAADAIAVSGATSVLSATGGSTTWVIASTDQYGKAVQYTPVAVAVAGRNTVASTSIGVTDANGFISYTLKDAGTTGTKDTLTFSSGTLTAVTATVTYGTVTVAKVSFTGGGTLKGVAPTTPTVNALQSGDTPEGSEQTASVTLTDASGNLLAGVPVTWSVSGTTGAAINSTMVTSYSSSAGVATSGVYAWLAGTYTVTATAGGITGTGEYTWANSTPADARVLSASADGGIVTAKVVDRFGNPVSGVTVYASRTSGNGYFGTGVTKISTTTGVAGTAEFILNGTADVKVSTLSYDAVAGTNASGQTCALAGNLDCAVGTTAAEPFTATTAGTTTVAAANVGSTFAPAGVSAVTVSVSNNAAADNAQAATDAAAEATDAANAATDAANAAAEAADAATAAAQDAADAVAALSAQVSTMMASLKAQLTALTNLVIKIQKKVKA